MKLSWRAAALVVALSAEAMAQVAILQIQVIEGEGGVHAPGARSARPLVVEITDETGRPVAGAAVSFHLPDDGPGGVFANGLRTDVTTTDERGRTSVRGFQLNRMAGRFEIRIVASKEQARAGTVSYQYIAAANGGGGAARAPDAGGRSSSKAPVTAGKSHGIGKWLLIVALAGGGAAAGLMAAHPGGQSSAASTSGQTSAAGALTLSIGTPTITVGKQ